MTDKFSAREFIYLFIYFFVVKYTLTHRSVAARNIFRWFYGDNDPALEAPFMDL